jgi:YgiT-type zinc finger domain-containing protein
VNSLRGFESHLLRPLVLFLNSSNRAFFKETMKCITCKIGDLQAETTSIMLEQDTTTVVFKNVPADVCQTCGEPYIDAAITRQLLHAVEDAARIGVQVDVRPFEAA